MINSVPFKNKQLSAKLMKAIQAVHSLSDEDLEMLFAVASPNHSHDGTQSPIAWNDVQAIRYYNEFSSDGLYLTLPTVPTEGYNKHYHTSEYDGGFLPGLGIHDHRDNAHGGFAFCVFHPATAVPQLPWES